MGVVVMTFTEALETFDSLSNSQKDIVVSQATQIAMPCVRESFIEAVKFVLEIKPNGKA
jgi:hypothetical protein